MIIEVKQEPYQNRGQLVDRRKEEKRGGKASGPDKIYYFYLKIECRVDNCSYLNAINRKHCYISSAIIKIGYINSISIY